MRSPKKIGILRFPASNCDRDVFKALDGLNAEFLPSRQAIEIENYRAFIIPGGFSYGDYLRAGALAALSPAMRDLKRAGLKGWPVLGICNGFQILCEAGLLEGALLPNQRGRFIDEWSHLRVENKNLFWLAGGEIKLPIAHGEGCYFAPEGVLKKLKDSRRVWITYQNNPNGSAGNIAGIMNERGNVAGLMPHPERAVADWMGGKDGLSFFKGLENAL